MRANARKNYTAVEMNSSMNARPDAMLIFAVFLVQCISGLDITGYVL